MALHRADHSVGRFGVLVGEVVKGGFDCCNVVVGRAWRSNDAKDCVIVELQFEGFGFGIAVRRIGVSMDMRSFYHLSGRRLLVVYGYDDPYERLD